MFNQNNIQGNNNPFGQQPNNNQGNNAFPGINNNSSNQFSNPNNNPFGQQPNNNPGASNSPFPGMTNNNQNIQQPFGNQQGNSNTNQVNNPFGQGQGQQTNNTPFQANTNNTNNNPFGANNANNNQQNTPFNTNQNNQQPFGNTTNQNQTNTPFGGMANQTANPSTANNPFGANATNQPNQPLNQLPNPQNPSGNPLFPSNQQNPSNVNLNEINAGNLQQNLNNIFNLEQLQLSFQNNPHSDPLLNALFIEFNKCIKEMFDMNCNSHIFQSYILKERTTPLGSVPGTQQSLTSLLTTQNLQQARYVQVDMQKYKKCEDWVKKHYPHLEHKVQPQVVTSFEELNQVADLYQRELEKNNENTSRVNNYINKLNRNLQELKEEMVKQKMMLVRLMLRQLRARKVDFKSEAMLQLANLNDQIKVQLKELKDIDQQGGLDNLLKLKPVESVDIEGSLNNYDTIREEIKGNISQIAQKLKENTDQF